MYSATKNRMPKKKHTRLNLVRQENDQILGEKLFGSGENTIFSRKLPIGVGKINKRVKCNAVVKFLFLLVKK